MRPVARPLVYVAGATGPALELHVRRGGTNIDLTGRTVLVDVHRDYGAALADRLANIDADQVSRRGVAYLTWAAGDLVDNAGAINNYRAEVRVITPSVPDPIVEYGEAPLEFRVRPRSAP